MTAEVGSRLVKCIRKRVDLCGVDDWDLVRGALDGAGLPSADFGSFTSGRHPEIIRPEVFDYEGSVGVLLACLSQVTDSRVKEAVVRSLSTGYARPVAAPALIVEFRATSDVEHPLLKWAIGNALDTVTDRSHTTELIDLVVDSTHGKGRQMVVSRVGRFKGDAQVTAALLELLDDEDVTLHAMGALRTQIGAIESRPHIAQRVDSPSESVRRQAVKQLKKIDRSIAKKAER